MNLKRHFALSASIASLAIPASLHAAPATLLFQDDFNRGIPGWTAVQPEGS